MTPMTQPQQNSTSKPRQLLDLFKDDWQWTFLYNVLFAASISFFVFARLLDFFITPTVNKIFVFISLFAFFLLLALFFITPITDGLKERPKAFLVILVISLVTTGILFFVLPEQRFAIRTTHTLRVSIPSDSGSVVLENFIGPTRITIPWEDVDFDGTVYEDSVTIPPGGELYYSREMTGGLTFMLSAPEKDAEVFVEWDSNKMTVPVRVGENVDLEMDPTSLGVPSRESRYLLLGVKANEWVCLFLALTMLLGGAYLFIKKDGFRYIIFQRDALRYLTDFLILAVILILVAIGYRAFRPNSLTRNLIILFPGIVFLILKVIYRIYPALPILLICFTLVVNVIAHWVWFDNFLLKANQISEDTFYELADIVYPSDTTMLSLGFYKQLRDSELVLPSGSFLADDVNVDRLIRINYHKNVYVLDYSGELSTEDYKRLLNLDGWTDWDRRNKGTFHYFRADLPVTTPIVVFTYENDNFLIPLNQLEGLGLFNDFVLD